MSSQAQSITEGQRATLLYATANRCARCVVTLVCALAAACQDGNPPGGSLPSQPATIGQLGAVAPRPAAASSSDASAARARHIRLRLEAFREWRGTHSPIPRRGITANTLAKVKPEITSGDAPALLILLQDEAPEIRSAVGTLYGCLFPEAEQTIQNLIDLEIDKEKRFRWVEARIQVQGASSGGIVCPL